MSLPKKPRNLFWYEFHELKKHKITMECLPEFVSVNELGERWRCRGPSHDHYGYKCIVESKMQEISDCEQLIYFLKEHVKKIVNDIRKRKQ